MAVTVTHSWQLVQLLDLTAGPAQGNVDVAGLANGGFAAVGDRDTNADLDIFNANAAHTGQATNILPAFAAIDELSDGNLVAIGLEDGLNQASFVVRNGGGGAVLGQTLVGGTETGAVDVAALTGGGFVLALGDLGDAVPSFLRVELRNNAGVFLTGFNIFEPNDNDFFNPAVAGLDDGGFAVAWEQDSGAIWTAVYNANGTVRRASTPYDSGANRNAAITATENGFAIVYETSDFSPNPDIALARFDANGGAIDFVTLSGPATIDETPRIARMANGMLAIAFGISNVATADSETFLELYDPGILTVVASRTVTAGEPITDDTDLPAIAGHGLGRAAVFHSNITDNDADGEELEVVRTSTGDANNDAVFGNDFIDIMSGGGGGDFMNGLANNDTLNGEAGDDTLLGGAGTDALNGGAGADTASYSAAVSGVNVNLALATAQSVGGGQGIDTISGVENLRGSNFADILTGNAGNNRLDGSFGADLMRGGLGNDTYDADAAGDQIVEAVNAGIDTIVTTLDSYSLFAIANVERLTYAELGNFVGRGNGLANLIRGGQANDRFIADQGGADTFVGDAGADTMDFRLSAAGAVVNLTAGVHGGAAAGDVYSSIEIFYGSNTAADSFTGNASNNRFEGYAGNDALFASGGADTVHGGLGNDRVDGGDGSDTWLGGDAGLDTITGGLGNDRIDGGADNDTFLGGDAGIDTVTGGLGNDRIDGGVDNDFLYGGAGIDTITDGGGADTMDGGADNDFLYGGAGIDTIAGGDGADTVNGGDDGDFLYGGAGIDTFIGGGGGDSINSGDGDDSAYGGDGDDVLQGLAGRDRLHGGLGGDTLYGGEEVGAGDTWLGGDAGADFIAAGGGNDRLEGGTENDELWGGLGLDTSNGGAGADYFDYRGVAEGGAGEQIGDWQGGIDNLRIDASGFGGGLVAGPLAANRLVIGTAATQAFGQFLYSSTNGVLYWDSNGTGAGGLNFLVKLYTPTFGAPPASLLTTDFEIVA